MMHPSLYAKKHPDKPAYIMASSGEVVTYRQLDERSNRGAHLFRSLGLKPGDHISIMMENNRSFYEVVWAAQRSGLIYTAISTHLKAEEVNYIVDNSDAKVLIASDKSFSVAVDALKHTQCETRVLVIGTSADDSDNYDKLVESMPITPIADECAGVDMLYSSGTTGQPKGVVVTLSGNSMDAIPAATLALMKLYKFNEDSVYLSPAPLYHAAPLKMNQIAMLGGGTCIIMEKFDEEFALRLIEKYQVTHSQWVPIMFTRMLRVEGRQNYDISSMQIAIHAAAPCAPELKKEMIDWWGPIIYEYYSSSESNGLTMINSEEWLSHEGSVGKAVVGVIHILDDEDNELPTGSVGNIYFADGQPFSYHKDSEKTKSAYNDRGWSSVGDVGYVDSEGYLYLTDRKSFMIISGGVNIYPQEVENLLSGHAKVADVAVIGIPNEDFGEEVKAVVQLIDSIEQSSAIADELIAYCKERISGVKCPRSVDFIDELPRYPNGKLYKKKIRDGYWEK